MTRTARGSMWFFWSYFVLGLLSLVLYVADYSASWVQLAVGLLWVVPAVPYFRSWRLLRSIEGSSD